MNLDDTLKQIEEYFASAWVNKPEVTKYLEETKEQENDND